MEEARHHYELAILGLAASYGEDDDVLIAPLTSLGTILYAMERYADAESALKRALAIEQRLHGKDRTTSARILISLGDIRLVEGRHIEAESLYRQAEAIPDEPAPGQPSMTLVARKRLATLLRATDRPADAAVIEGRPSPRKPGG